MKKETKYIVITLCCILGIVLGSTTAWYTWTSNTNTDVTFAIEGVTIDYNAGYNIDGKNLRPTSNKKGEYAIQKEVTISSSKRMNFNLYLTADVFPIQLQHESLKWEVYESDELISSGNFSNVLEKDVITLLYNIQITENVRTFNIYIWIDGENYENPSDMGGQTYKFVLKAEATDQVIEHDPSGANVPELMTGMVPVTFNENKKCGELKGVTQETAPECFEELEVEKESLLKFCYNDGYGTGWGFKSCTTVVNELIANGSSDVSDVDFLHTLPGFTMDYLYNGGEITSEINMTPELRTEIINSCMYSNNSYDTYSKCENFLNEMIANGSANDGGWLYKLSEVLELYEFDGGILESTSEELTTNDKNNLISYCEDTELSGETKSCTTFVNELIENGSSFSGGRTVSLIEYVSVFGSYPLLSYKYININAEDRSNLINHCENAYYLEDFDCSEYVNILINDMYHQDAILGEYTITKEEFIDEYKEYSSDYIPKYTLIEDADALPHWSVASYSNDDYDWYNYNEQKWANAVLVSDKNLRNATEGTVISEDQILAQYVWIPRYKYKLFNANKEAGVDYYNAETIGIEIVFEQDLNKTGTVSCSISSTGSETCKNMENGDWYTHPAFWWDKDNDRQRDSGEELTGIWISKFQLSSNNPSLENGGGNSTELSVRIKGNTTPWSYNTLSNYFEVVGNMTKLNNEYGLIEIETDSHVIKNIEWGALVYLTHSKYGRCLNENCTSIEKNSETPYVTGGGNYVNNTQFSTTNNITGIYDIFSVSGEMVMGNMLNGSGNFYVSSSGFSTVPMSKYYDVYEEGPYSYDMSRAHLGDATGEIYVRDYGRLWKNQYGSFVNANTPWFLRNDVSFDVINGSGGTGGESFVTRSVLIKN